MGLVCPRQSENERPVENIDADATVPAHNPGGRSLKVNASPIQVTPSQLNDMGLGYAVGLQEHLLWANVLLQHMWTNLDELAQHIVQEQVEPAIRKKVGDKMMGIRLSQFTLGTRPPDLTFVDVYDLPHGSVALHVTVDYQSNMAMEVCSDRVAPFGVRNFGIFGEIVFLMRPFIAEHPGTGGVTVYFINPPDVTLDFTGLARTAQLKGIKSVIRDAIDGALADRVVLPNCITQLVRFSDMKLYPMVMGTPRPIGTVRVTLLGAKHLPSGDWGILGGGGHADNYFRIGLGDHKWCIKASCIGEICEFMVFDPEVRLHVDLWDEDQLSEDDHLGHREGMYLFEAVRLSEQPLQLFSPGSTTKKAGTVVLKIQYFEGINMQPGSDGCMVMVMVREIQLPHTMAGCRINMRAKLGSVEHTSPMCRPVTNTKHVKLVGSLMEDMRQRLQAYKLDEDSIEKLTQVKGLKCMPTKVDMACNHCMMFSLESVEQLDEGCLSLTLLQWFENKASEQSLLDVTATMSTMNTKLPKLEESTLATSRMRLSDLMRARNHVLPGPVTMLAEDGTIFVAEISVALFGLHPADPPVIHIDRSSKRRRSAWNTWEGEGKSCAEVLCPAMLP